MKDRSTRPVPVWDLPIRLFHWVTVLLVAGLWGSAQWGRMPLHAILGEASLALVLFRLAWGLAGSPTARFRHFVKGPRAILAYLRAGYADIGHNPLGALSVLALLGMLGLLGATGLFASDDIFTEGPLAYLVSAKAVSLLSTMHRIGFKLLLALVAMHLGAILFYRVFKKDDLLIPMLTGRKSVPPGIDGIRFAGTVPALVLLAAAAAAVFGGLALYGK